MSIGRRYWTNRLGHPEDTAAFLDLFGKTYADRPGLNRDYWMWRYLNDTAFRAEIMMAEHDGRPIGIQPVAIFDYQWGVQRLTGAMYTGVLTHPDHRRRGVFHSLIDSTNEYVARRGAQFSMTLPNDASLQGFIRFGEWKYPGLIPVHLKIADGPAEFRSKLGGAAALLRRLPHTLFRRRSALVHDPDLEYARVVRVPDDLNDVFDEFARDCGTLMIRRTAAYWNWRYGAKPTSDYCTLVTSRADRVMGAVVTSVQRRLGLDFGMIVDVVARGGTPVLRGLLRSAERELISRGVGLITCQATSPLLQRALQEEGYRCPQPRWLPKRFHFVYRTSGVPGLRKPPSDLADWHLTFGDSDNV